MVIVSLCAFFAFVAVLIVSGGAPAIHNATRTTGGAAVGGKVKTAAPTSERPTPPSTTTTTTAAPSADDKAEVERLNFIGWDGPGGMVDAIVPPMFRAPDPAAVRIGEMATTTSGGAALPPDSPPLPDLPDAALDLPDEDLLDEMDEVDAYYYKEEDSDGRKTAEEDSREKYYYADLFLLDHQDWDGWPSSSSSSCSSPQPRPWLFHWSFSWRRGWWPASACPRCRG